MADIKTRDTVKGTIKTLDKATVAGQKMKEAYIATKEKAERSVNANENTAEEYAADKVQSGIDEISHDAVYTRQWQTKIALPTQSPMVIAKTAFQLFEKRYGWLHPIRSVTVQAINLIPQDTPRQIDMFMDAAKQDKLERMEKCVEEIRRRFGKDSIRNGVLCQNLRLPPEKAEITMPTGMVG